MSVFRRSFIAVSGIVLVAAGCRGDEAGAVRTGDDDTADTRDGAGEIDTAVVNPWGSYDDEPGTAVRFDPARTDGFFSFPFPSDLRRRGAGAEAYIDWFDFPNPSDIVLLADYLTVAASLDGFSTNGAMYVPFDGPIDTAALPDPAGALRPDAAVQLVSVSPESPDYGRRVPLVVRFYAAGGRYVAANTLAAYPHPGFPLRARTRYALIVTAGLRAAGGAPLGVPGRLKRALTGDTGGDADLDALVAAYEPLRTWATTPDAVPVAAIRAAVVFTTQSPTAELARIRDVVNGLPVPTVDGPTPDAGCDTNEYRCFRGTYRTPNFQRGTVPYSRPRDGGAFAFDDAGTPLPARDETVAFVLTVPRLVPAPGAAVPVVMYGHGTGGSRNTMLGSGAFDEAAVFARAGLAGLSIDQPIHGVRAEGKTFNVEYASFNFTNPASARCLFRQAAVDLFVQARMIAAGRFDGAGGALTRDRVLYMGHSQGGLTGSIGAPFLPEVRAFMMSGAGGLFALNITRKKSPVDVLGVARALMSIDETDPDTAHPVLTLVQTIIDAGDPVNYAPLYFADGRAADYLYTEGFYDTFTPWETTEALSVAARIPTVAPVLWDSPGPRLAGLAAVDGRITGNVARGRATAGRLQYKPDEPDEGHFTIYHDPAARDTYAEFLRSAAFDGRAVILR